MAIDEVAGQAWTRKHDDPSIPVVPSALRTVYPKSLEELIEICSRKPSEKIHAAGSHWALSGAAISDSVFVETHDPNNMHEAMGRTLYDVVGMPGCLNPAFIDELASRTVLPFDTKLENVSVAENEGIYPIHIETGKRVYQLYAELDAGDYGWQSLATYLANDRGKSTYLGSWAFHTLGGAGGQTVFGALTTGTHGGDMRLPLPEGKRMPPIADAVMALHLVADGGKHYWIEPESTRPGLPRLTDDAALMALYGQPRYRGPNGDPNNFEIKRCDNLFNSVLISAGRFGIVYSIVIAAVRQYCLHHERRLKDSTGALLTWQALRGQINDRTSALYTGNDQLSARLSPPPSPNKYLQVVVNVTPFENFTKNRAAVTKAWNVALAATPGTTEPAGRRERRGAIIPGLEVDTRINAPRFAFAGNSFPYPTARAPDFLGLACSDADFMDGVVSVVINEIDIFLRTNGATLGATIATVVAVATVATGGLALAVLLAALTGILPILAALLLLLHALPKPLRLGDVMNALMN